MSVFILGHTLFQGIPQNISLELWTFWRQKFLCSVLSPSVPGTPPGLAEVLPSWLKLAKIPVFSGYLMPRYDLTPDHVGWVCNGGEGSLIGWYCSSPTTGPPTPILLFKSQLSQNQGETVKPIAVGEIDFSFYTIPSSSVAAACWWFTGKTSVPQSYPFIVSLSSSAFLQRAV